jgi:hypothetical protein
MDVEIQNLTSTVHLTDSLDPRVVHRIAEMVTRLVRMALDHEGRAKDEREPQSNRAIEEK